MSYFFKALKLRIQAVKLAKQRSSYCYLSKNANLEVALILIIVGNPF